MTNPRSTSAPSNVWLVEDNAMFRETIAELLDETGGLSCSLAAGSCEEALQALDDGSLPDVILMDIGLPGMDGIRGVEQIKTRAPSVNVVMLTVHHDDDRIFRAVCAGASGYLLKTADPAEIVDAVTQVHAGGAAIDARIARRVLEMFARFAAPQADYGLSTREDEILHMLVDGLTKAGIADRLHLSRHTVDGHIRNIYAKLHVHSRTAAVAKALKENLL